MLGTYSDNPDEGPRLTKCDSLYERAVAAADAALLQEKAPFVRKLTAKLAELGITATVDPRTAQAESCGVGFGCSRGYYGKKKLTVNAWVICDHVDKTSEYHTELHQRSAHNVETVADLKLVLERARECAAYKTPVEAAQGFFARLFKKQG